MKRYWRIWTQMAQMSLGAQLSYGMGSLGFLLGKLIRLLFFFAYIVAIFRHTDRLAGYSLLDVVLFFLTFNLVDITAQVFFRGIYAARRVVADGDLDTYLTQPCSPLLRMACSSVDFLDVVSLVPVLILMVLAWQRLPAGIHPVQIGTYFLLVFNGITIALAIHIFVGALTVRTQELENTIWVYRDMMFLGKFPMDIYTAPLRWALITIIPIGVMVSFPTKALLGTLAPGLTAYALALSSILMAGSLVFWRNALKHYTSVSS